MCNIWDKNPPQAESALPSRPAGFMLESDLMSENEPHTQKDPNPQLALVTGSAHRVGRILALELAGLGYDIALNYFHADENLVDETVRLIEARGQQAYPLQADLTQPEEIARMFFAISELPAELRIVVNSSAVMPAGSVGEASLRDWQIVMDLNLRAPWLCTRAAASLMKPGGLVIHICDEFSAQVWQRFALYGLSKNALEHLTRMQAREYSGRMRVNGMALGPVLPPDDLPAGMWDRVAARSVLGRATDAASIGQTLAYLIENDYISGEIIQPGDHRAVGKTENTYE